MKALFFFCLLFFLSACTQQAPEGEELPSTCPPDCSGGSSAIVTTINAPLDDGTVYVGDRLTVSVNLHNKGEANAEEGLVCITGLDGSLFSGLGGCTCESFYLVLDDTDDPSFEKTTLTFPSQFISTEASGTYHLTFYTRYAYTTYAPFSLCLTGDPYNEDTCSVSGNKVLGSSSGPVQVSSVTEELTPIGGNAVTLRLHIEAEPLLHDTAQLVELEDISNPTCLLLNQDGKIAADISVILFGESHECGRISFDLEEENGKVSCRIENIPTSTFIGEQTSYNGWVRIDYGYQDIQSVTFTVAQG